MKSWSYYDHQGKNISVTSLSLSLPLSSCINNPECLLLHGATSPTPLEILSDILEDEGTT